MSSINDSQTERRSNKPSSIAEILDRTQGHLILKWNASRSAERLRQIGLTSLYCLVALISLTVFIIESYFQDRSQYAGVLLIFVGLTIGSYFYLRVTGNRHVTNTFLVLLLAVLCLFLLYTGGIDGTGPLWYFVFPIFALFVQRLWAGVIAVIALFVITAWLLWNPVAGFDPDQYSQIFKERFLAVYLAISIMAFLYAFLRTSSEMVMDNLSQHLQKLADTDDLTRLPNRRRMQDVLYQEISRLRRGGKPFCVILMDIDEFKSVNDTYGHDCGDNTLKIFSKEISLALRTQDVCARWGGEEFIVMLPETRLQNAVKVAERVREAIQNKSMTCGDEEFTITVSMGIREFQPLDDLDHCIKEVDKKLFQAKAEGGNCVIS